jgi:predicted ATPase/DNA-binding SARP family transcriptional activator/Tfp pilus assembly protein PilF
MWKIQLLGGLAACNAERIITRFPTQKAASLFAFLAYQPIARTRETLIEMLWPDAEIEAGRHNLSNAISFLRHALEPRELRPGTVIVADRCTVRFNPDELETDTELFQEAIKRSRVEGQSEDDRLSWLMRAVDLYRGPLLPGFYDDWIGPEALRLENLFVETAVQLVPALLAKGQAETVLPYIERAVAAEPLSEEATVGLIQTLSALGRRTQALRAYRTFSERLREELDAEPSDRIQFLLQSLSKDDSVRVTESITHETIELPISEPLNEVASPRLVRNQDRLIGGEFRLRTTTKFFGREDEVVRLGKMLSTPHIRLVTLSGSGGTGKTRLAVEAAAEIVGRTDYTEHAPKVAVFVSLSEVTEGQRLSDVILRAMGIHADPGSDSLLQLAQVLESQPNTLLILDNFEQLVEDGALLLRDLLSSARTVKLLVTSRQTLRIEGENEFHLAALPTSGGVNGMEKLLAVPSVALFVDRAQATLPSFQLTERNADVIGQLCDELEGLPLSIELAAARSSVLSPNHILEQVRANRLDFLATHWRDRESRQRTLRATLDWSYRLLPEPGRRSLWRLAVFRGGWTLEAAQAVIGASKAETLEMLTVLRDSSLISVADIEDGLNFKMLETIRQYAAEQLEVSGEKEAVLDRHCNFFLSFAEAAEPHLSGPEQDVWLARLESDYENLRAALEWSKAKQEGFDVGLRLAAALGRFWEVRAHLKDGRMHLKELLTKEQRPQRSPERARALSSAGVLAWNHGDYSYAVAVLEESLSIWRELGDMPGIARSLNELGVVAREQCKTAEAKEFHDEGLRLFRELGDKRGIANSLHFLGLLATRQGTQKAKEYFKEGLTIFRELGDKVNIGWSLFQLGTLACVQGDLEQAPLLYTESLATFRELRDERGTAWSIFQMGLVATRQGNHQAAKKLLEDSLAIWTEVGDKRGVAAAIHQLGLVAALSGDYCDAKSRFKRSLSMTEEAGDSGGMGWSYQELGNVATVEAELDLALEYYGRAIEIWDQIGEEMGRAWAVYDIGYVALHQHNFPSAKENLHRALAMFRNQGQKLGVAWCVLRNAQVDIKKGEIKQARPQLEQSQAVFLEGRERRGMAFTLEAFAELSYAEGRPETATQLWAAAGAFRNAVGLPLPPVDRPNLQANISAIREEIGDEEFFAAWSQGENLSEDAAMELALQQGLEAHNSFSSVL